MLNLYQRITGTTDDFFDVDFEDEEDEYDRNNQPVVQPKEVQLLVQDCWWWIHY